jgi:hypothetical protein
LLDVGCAEGYIAESVKKIYPQCETWGVEPLASAAQRLPRGSISVLCGKLENERVEGINFVEFGRAKYVLARAKVL